MTANQIYRKGRKDKRKNKLDSILLSCPQRSVVAEKVYKQNPKKPNSANRPAMKGKLKLKVRVSGKTQIKYRSILVHIPGEGHNLQQHSRVLIRGGNTPDLPGFKYKAIRGVYDTSPVKERKKGRSKYGAKSS